MTFDDATLMAYADGEIDAATAGRITQAIARDPALGAQVESHRALRHRLDEAFAPIAREAVPDRLAALLTSTVVPFSRAGAPPVGEMMAIAASLVVAMLAGHAWRPGPLAVSRGQVVASGALALALDRTLAADRGGATRMLVSFRDRSGVLCRVFAAPAVDGIACRDGGGWAVIRTRAPATEPGTAYRTAASAAGALMADAQDLMRGPPLDAVGERRARRRLALIAQGQGAPA